MDLQFTSIVKGDVKIIRLYFINIKAHGFQGCMQIYGEKIKCKSKMTMKLLNQGKKLLSKFVFFLAAAASSFVVIKKEAFEMIIRPLFFFVN